VFVVISASGVAVKMEAVAASWWSHCVGEMGLLELAAFGW